MKQNITFKKLFHNNYNAMRRIIAVKIFKQLLYCGPIYFRVTFLYVALSIF